MDATQLQERPVEQIITTLRVEVVDGPDRGKEATSTEVLSIGTAKDNVLAIGDFTVSRYHLEIAVKPNGIAITDLGSTNGTYVNDQRVVLPVTLVNGAKIRIANNEILFEQEAEHGGALRKPSGWGIGPDAFALVGFAP